jgi:hypothetical protein
MNNKYIIAIGVSVVIVIMISIWTYTSTLNVQKKIWSSNFCERDEDCVNVNFGCPYGCGIYVNSNRVNSLKRLTQLSNLLNPANLLVKCSCLPPPKIALCSEKKCVPKICDIGVYYSNFKYFADRECACPEGSVINITDKGMICSLR